MRPLVVLAVGLVAVVGAVLTPGPLRARTSPLVQDLPLIGGGGGTSFTRNCPDGHVLTGFRWRTGLLIDAIGIKCRPVRSDGTLGTEINVGTMVGGNGGTAGSASCPGSVVAGQNGTTAGVGISGLFFRCYTWYPQSRSYGGGGSFTITVRWEPLLASLSERQCSSGTAPATGIRGRHGSLVDAVGLKCGEP